MPFIAKALGLPLVKLRFSLMAGETLESVGLTEEPRVPGVFVKAPVFPFRRFPGVDPVLGPEMKSTGEVMGASSAFGNAFAKAWLGAGHQLPLSGTALPLGARPGQAVPDPGGEPGWRIWAST